MNPIRVGFVGLGRMGSPMAERLRASAEFSLAVFDPDEDAAAPFRAKDVIVSDRVSDSASCSEVLILCLPTPDVLLGVVDQVVDAWSGSHDDTRLVVNTSTTGMRASQEAAARLGDVGAQYVDAPVSGGTRGAAEGTMTIMVSGDPVAKERCGPLLRLLGSTIVDVGDEVGQAQAVKAANNMLGLSALMLTAEAAAVLSELGVPLPRQLDVFNASSGVNSATLSKYPQHVVTGTFDFGFSVESVIKDLSMFVEAAEAAGIEVQLAESSRARWIDAARSGWADSDCTRIEEFVRSLPAQPDAGSVR